ncbi:N-acetylglutaminylglutamine amidotransferase [Candidatus Venteria ishoeyi]|uniref:asparagine synthase (glutamine-hydrolyzing) n=1 Tax=Candidatus Venteria ishoeyi TaxID=1899563 RepID=A0A1H6FGG5_9GAMM|nr:N-acetylglutaminylglutamine amidotransferase [Candidatus Venteria ishoeyi]MDM8546781.1 N-acetylglutaminylglutamine amidotransferase [Candidatus Venteria ishoeyi]SEH09152.1 Asparagine synthetase [glutamine-hydrolyzing] 1 [Candidatus Venteria ishoeyi]SEH09281.1 Asparagine synthetase [glutamine-hydrolyzing] 1 [Candidatus Venteria ishoeyi]
MCGICGELRLDNALPDMGRLTRMMDKLAPRGPDHAGSYSDGALALGHRRLSIIDLSPRAHQPMVDSTLGLVLVFNGTIYNYRALRNELQGLGYQFFSDGDSEVILKAYHAWGEQCVTHFQGMFAFAIWDNRAQKLFLARDRIGIKPLYFSHNSRWFRFASNPQSLLASGDIDTSIDAVALHHQLTLHAVIPAPRTILSGIRKIEPATTMTIDRHGRQHSRTYWELNAQRPEQSFNEGQWLEQAHTVLREAVEKRKLAADVPVGVLLSGGLDSSLLVALLAELGDVEHLRTFSIGFEDQPEEKGSEFEYSDQVIERYPTQHQRLIIPNSEVLERLPEAVTAMSEPMVAQDAIAFYLLGERVSQEVKVVQSGQGADEVFAGYFWYPQMQSAYAHKPPENAAMAPEHYLEHFRNYYFDRDHPEFLDTVQSPYHGEDYTGQLIKEKLSHPGADEFLDRVLRLDVTTLVVDDPVKRVDNMTMAWGLEARVPFLDHHLVELAAQMPPEMKLRENGKYPLKALARQCLPNSVIDRPKGYFPVPALKYVRGPFLDFMQEVLYSDSCRQRGLFQSAYVEKLLAAPESYLTRIQGSKLWHLALLEFWLQTHI